MIFNEHYRLQGKHAFLSASKYHWVNYDREKLSSSYLKFLATEEGTRKHELAKMLIEMKERLPKSKKTLPMFVNDAIGFHMTPEQPLYYSDNAFGTCDAISFRKNVLRIHDLKTGESPTSPTQLMVYAAYFCLEYGVKPEDIDICLRIYQHDDFFETHPEPEKIREIMDKTVEYDKLIDKIKVEGD